MNISIQFRGKLLKKITFSNKNWAKKELKIDLGRIKRYILFISAYLDMFYVHFLKTQFISYY